LERFVAHTTLHATINANGTPTVPWTPSGWNAPDSHDQRDINGSSIALRRSRVESFENRHPNNGTSITATQTPQESAKHLAKEASARTARRKANNGIKR
jgi:hypothetical protein